MASGVLHQTEVEAFGVSMPTDSCSLAKLGSSRSEDSAFTSDEDGLYISTAEGLKGAKAALMAIGLEAAAAFFLYGIWQAWRILR